jgi:hypothetical protein
MKLKVFLVFFLVTFSGQSQVVEYSAEASLQAMFSSEEQNPFYLYTNQRGRIDEVTDVAGWLTGSGKFFIDQEAFFEIGGGVLYQNGFTDKVQLDEYYVSYTNSWMQAFAGRKQRKELYWGLSATNENVLWSLNARPLPGIGVRTIRPVYFWKDAGLGFKAEWQEFLTDDQRYVENLRVHHKSFHLVFSKIRNFELTFGVQHFVQWAGNSPDYGKLPSGFNDYTKVFLGREGEDDVSGEEANALGNQLGSYEIYLNTSISHYNVQLLYNTLFEDKSGLMLRNTPDGRYGFYIEDQDPDKWLQAFMYEYYYTRNQSKNFPTPDGKDNYFNNNLYRSGWTYQSRVIGLPFILINDQRERIGDNNIVAHHIGLTGNAFYQFPFKLLTSFRMNYGAKSGSSTPNDEVFSGMLDLQVWQGFLKMNLLIGGDIHTSEKNVFGAGLRVHKEIL